MRDELADSTVDDSGLYCYVHQRPYIWDGDIEICPECEGEMICGDEVEDFLADEN